MVSRLVLTFLILAAAVHPARAAEDCAARSLESVAGPLAIVKGMADYKAAMDAGYAACMVKYPQEFAPLRPVNDFMQGNMTAELKQARSVVGGLIDPECPAAKAGAERVIDGQYKKAFSRRHKILMNDGEKDSCATVLEMVRGYEEYYGRFKQLHHVLYESSKKQSTGIPKAAFRNFEKIRDSLVTDGQ